LLSYNSLDQIKLKKVVLFKIGIGSFQKVGVIDLTKIKTIRISFAKTVMNDLLKTFSILRLGGDLLVSGVSYEAKDTNRIKLLEDSQINLPELNTMSALIKQLRGTKVKITMAKDALKDGAKDGILQGKVLGTQVMKLAPTGQAIIDCEYVLLATEGNSVQPISIADITNLDILEPSVEKDFGYFLETIVGQNKEKNTMVTLFFEGKEKSEYIINFLQEVPAWKTSYRLFMEEASQNDSQPSLSDDKSDSADKDIAAKATKQSKKSTKVSAEKKSAITSNADVYNFDRSAQLQGWAIIDNVLDEDWEDVDLTLVTGLPVSFIYDSYSPAWITRPTIERKTDMGVKIVQYDRAIGGVGAGSGAGEKKAKEMMKRAAPMKPCAVAAAPPPPGAPPGGAMSRAMYAKADIAGLYDKEAGAYPAEAEMDDQEAPEPEQAFEAGAEAEGGKGVAFKYHIGTPVFVKRNNSSLIPILQGGTEGQIVSIYNHNVNKKNPMITYSFKNQTGLTLEEGPISIFINKIFSGEAMLPFLENGEQCRIPYAVDQSVDIKYTEDSRNENIHEIRVDNDVRKFYYTTYEFTYSLNNASDLPKQIIIEHPRYTYRELFKTQDPFEATATFNRFMLKLDGKQKMEFKVKERQLNSSYDSIPYVTNDLVSEWVRLKLIKTEESEYLKKRIKLQLESNNVQASINTLAEKKRMIYDEQARLRENLKSIKDSKAELELRKKYIAKFDERETELEQNELETQKLTDQIKMLNEQISNLAIEWIKLKNQQELATVKGGKN
jgi:hypothetical protein